MKRFYKVAESRESEGGFGVFLDGKPIKTPAGSLLTLPNSALASATANEWESAGGDIDPSQLHFTQLANTALDKGEADRSKWLEEVSGYLDGDTVFYRANDAIMFSTQAERWDPVLKDAERAYGVALIAKTGIMPHRQSDQCHEVFGKLFAGLDRFCLVAALSVVRGLSSVLLTEALCLRKTLSFEEAWALSRLEAEMQEEKWGVDPDAAALDMVRRTDVEAAHAFFALASDTTR